MSVTITSLKNVIYKPLSGEWGDGEGETNILRTTNFTNDGKLNLDEVVTRNIELKKISQKQLKYGDTIIEKSGGSPNQPVGRVVYFDQKEGTFLCNNFTSVIRGKSEIDKRYLFWFLFNNHLTKNTLKYQNKTTGIINLQLERYIEEIQIPLPPLHIQKQIAQILDTADALKRKDQQLLKKYDELAQAIFIDMFGDPVKNEKGWEVKKLSQVLDVDAKAVNPSTLNGYNYIGLEHIEKETGKILVIDKGEIVSNKFIFSKEHILYGKLRPYLNKVATPNFSGICSTDIFPLKPKNSLMKQFLVSILRSRDFVNHSNTNAVGANLPRANKEIILNYKTIVPDIKTAQMFSKNIDLVTAQKIKVENQILKSNSLFQTLLQKAFNNELVTE
jgi:type I restriction enzyme S subunit